MAATNTGLIERLRATADPYQRSTEHLLLLCDEAADALERAERERDGWWILYRATREELHAYRSAAVYDAMMEGPRFKTWNRSQLDRARRMTEAALKSREATP